ALASMPSSIRRDCTGKHPPEATRFRASRREQNCATRWASRRRSASPHWPFIASAPLAAAITATEGGLQWVRVSLRSSKLSAIDPLAARTATGAPNALARELTRTTASSCTPTLRNEPPPSLPYGAHRLCEWPKIPIACVSSRTTKPALGFTHSRYFLIGAVVPHETQYPSATTIGRFLAAPCSRDRSACVSCSRNCRTGIPRPAARSTPHLIIGYEPPSRKIMTSRLARI